MQIKEATKAEKIRLLEVARSLNEWFNSEGLKNMETDFSMNQVAVALDGKNVLGFICYNSYCGKIQIMWMGVKREMWRKGVGSALLKWLEGKAKELHLHSIEVETLPEEDEYPPYEQTRNFYYKNGFKRVMYKKARIEGWDDQIVLEKRLD